jgi:outer membrane protein
MLAGVLTAVAMAGPAWADMKVGVVNYARLMQESPQYKAAQAALQAEFAPKQKALQTLQTQLKAKEDSLQKDGATMTADQRTKLEKDLRDGNRDLSQKTQEFQDDVNSRQNEELSKLQKALVEEVQTYAQQQKFDLVLADGVIYANNTLDITPAVLSSITAKSGTRAPAAAPAAPAAPAVPAKPASK